MIKAPETLLAQALGWLEPQSGAISPSIAMSSTFAREGDLGYRDGRVYIRADNPAFDQAEAMLCALEGAKASALFGSGMAACTAAILALDPGDHIVAPSVMYWALSAWLKTTAARLGIATSFAPLHEDGALAKALQPGRTKLVWIETPANPLWCITDITKAAELAHGCGARLIVDSTVATPMLTQPLKLGADLVMHSATKALNGHSDLCAGMLASAAKDAFWERILDNRARLGAISGSMEAWLLVRGMRTLHLRVERACANALALAQRLESNPQVAQVLYPGLPSFAGHDIAARQMRGGFGSMLSIRVKGGEARAIAAAAKVEIWKRATSLGGVESLIEHRASVEGPSSPCPPDLLRLSVGCEALEDLAADLDAALTDPSA